MYCQQSHQQILIPSGAVVKVSIGTEFGGENSMNVFVFPSVHDVSKSGGLCGKLSNTVEGAFVLRNGTRVHYVEDFIKSWSVEDQNNLFNESTSHELKRWDSSVEYCSCPACNTTPCSEIQCGPMQEVDGSYKYRPHVRVVSNIKRCSIHARRKRSTVKPNLHQMSVHKRDTPDLVNDWTRENATAFCEKHFDLSSSAKMCLEIQTVNITKNIEYCVLDILASGSTEFLGAALDSMQTSCMHALVMNSTFHHKIEEESILDKFVKVTCPYGCSMKGDCADGVCRCHGNFSGSDCSVDISYPPKITDVEFEGLCDVNEDPCTAIALFGKTFVESSRTICRFRHLANENHTSDGLSVTTAHFQSLLEVACPIPVHRSKRSAIGSKAEDKPRVFYVSVSNNGVAYSEERIVVIYNSTCQTCTLSGTSVNCVTLEDYCTVGTQCIPEGGRYPFGECLVCDINGNERTWQEDP
ncbi:von Willebrand factor D and EGF domain-containing protein-like, partial [Gigantopelta aegis]|uniref:von Willebrand factor D and EGF domain-containing protein-like n=1 Tax=Gigantopelta aegis TaxID=1735272 RepID=UPI001B88A947